MANPKPDASRNLADKPVSKPSGAAGVLGGYTSPAPPSGAKIPDQQSFTWGGVLIRYQPGEYIKLPDGRNIKVKSVDPKTQTAHLANGDFLSFKDGSVTKHTRSPDGLGGGLVGDYIYKTSTVYQAQPTAPTGGGPAARRPDGGRDLTTGGGPAARRPDGGRDLTDPVKQFQTNHGLVPDGIVGPQTLAAGYTGGATTSSAPATATGPAAGGGQLNQFLNAIAQEESGGSYTAVGPMVNGDRAYGKYQIMGSNIAAWSREVLGHSVSLDEYRNSPALQEQIARGKLTQYFNSYGAAGAASAWFTGSPTTYQSNPGASDGNTTAAKYVQNVLHLMGGASSTLTAVGATGGAAGGAGVGFNAGISPGAAGVVGGMPGTGALGVAPGGDMTSLLGPDGKVDSAKAIATYGYIAALAANVPDIKNTLDAAIQGGWTPDHFAAVLQGTNWYKKTSDAQRQATILKASNPGEYARQRNLKLHSIDQTQRQIGVSLSAADLNHLTDQAVALGWSDQEITNYVTAQVKVTHGGVGLKGQAAVTTDALKNQAADYYVPLSDQTPQQWTQQILRGSVPAASFTTYLKEQAKSMFPNLTSAIDSGVTVKQYVEPYRQIAARTLEIAPDSVNLHDPKFGKGLTQVDPKTGQRVSMSLSDYQTYLRGLPDYEHTDQARQQAASLTENITKMFGAIA